VTPFEDLLRELGTLLETNLQPDSHASCCLVFGDDVKVQIDLDGTGERILMGSTVGSIPPGIYREKILRQALLINGQEMQPKGTLAFSEKNDSLVLFQFYILAKLSGERLYPLLLAFAEEVRKWKEALKRGEVPALEDEALTKSGFMGLK